MNMVEKTDSLLSEYSKTLTGGLRDSYLPIIKNSFFPYLLHISEKTPYDADFIFNSALTEQHIIEAGVMYIDRTRKATNMGAVRTYLSAVGELCRRLIFKQYPNCTLKSITDFQSLFSKIVLQSTKSLSDKAPHAHIEKDDYARIDAYLSALDNTQPKQQIIIAVFRLMLLYGFKIGIISNIKKSDYSATQNTLRIAPSCDDDDFVLELPYLLSRQLNMVFDANLFESDFLFLTESGQPLSSDYFDYTLTALTKQLSSSFKITLTGLAKFAVINMFLEGMNPIVIGQITGMKDAYLNYCQKVAYDRTKSDASRYINSKLRSISTYDDFNL